MLIYVALVTSACARECKLDNIGIAYRGTVNTTHTGKTCQSWEVTSPHHHTHTRLFTEKNFCRNPDYEDFGPWCYTIDENTKYESCNITLCGTFVCKKELEME